MYMNHVHFTQIKERVAASLGDSLFAEALSCVVKAGHVQNKVATSWVRRKVSVSVATNGPFW